MSSKIVEWLVGARDAKILGFKKKSGILNKNSRKNQEMVNTKFLPSTVMSESWGNFLPSCTLLVGKYAIND